MVLVSNPPNPVNGSRILHHRKKEQMRRNKGKGQINLFQTMTTNNYSSELAIWYTCTNTKYLVETNMILKTIL